MPKGFLLESFVLNSCIPSQPKLKKSFEPIGDQLSGFCIEAGLRLYAQLLTNAWRKRCKQLNELNDTFRILKEASQRAAENLEWKNSCYFEKQYENEDLTCQLHLSLRDIAQGELSIEELLLEVQRLELRKQELLLKITDKTEKCISCNADISDLKLKVMKLADKNRLLELELKNETDKADKLENSHEMAAEQVVKYKAAVAYREELLRKEIEKLDGEIQSTKIERKLLKTEILNLSKITGEMRSFDAQNTDISTRFEKCLLTQQVVAVRRSLEKTFEHKIFKNALMALAIIAKALKMISPVFPTHIMSGGFTATGEIGYVIYI